MNARRGAEQAVSSVVGTTLMLAVTVAVFGGLSVVVLDEVRSQEPGPESRITFVAEGNRAILTHRGGQDIPLDDGYVLLNVNGASLRYDLTAFAAQVADGETWRIGETLCVSGPSPPDPARTCLLEDVPVLGAAVVAGGNLVSEEGDRGGDPGPCPFDNDPPTVATPWAVVPDVMSTTTGTVDVTLTASDGCAGVDDAVDPVLSYRIQDGTSPPFAVVGPMTNVGPGQWTGTVPAQSWNLLGGKVLQFQATGVTDQLGNVGGATATESEAIEAVTLVTYVTGVTATKGTVGALGPAQAAGDGDTATTVTEGGTTNPAGSGGPTKLSGTATANNAATSPDNVLASDDAHATLDATGEWIEVTGFDVPGGAASITSVSIGYEGRKTGSGSSPTTRLDYKVGTGAFSNGASITESQTTTDIDRTRSLCASQAACTSAGLSVANVEAMTVRVWHVTDQTPNVLVDHVFVTVAYTTAPTTTYSLDVSLEFSGADDGSSETLELRFRTAGDTYTIEVFDPVLGYTPVGTLDSAGAFATFTHTLTGDQFNGGAPRIRLRDATPTGTSPGTLELDHARVVTV